MRFILISGLLALLCGAWLTGCGGGGEAPKPTVLQPTVSMVTEQDATTQFASVTDDSVVLQAGAPTHSVGDVLVSDTGDGLLRKVMGVTPNTDGTTTLQTEQAALTDVFQSVEIHQQYTITSDDVRSITPKTRGVTLRARVPGSRADSGFFTTELQLDVPLAAGGALNLNGTLGIGLKLNFDLVIDKGILQAFQLTVAAEATASLALEAKSELKVPLSHIEKDLATIQFARITILVPTPAGVPAPIVFTFNMVPYVYDDCLFTTTSVVTLAKLEAKLSLQGGIRVNQNLSVSPVTSATLTKPTLTGLLPDLAATSTNSASGMKTLVDLVRNTNLEFKILNSLGLGARFECKLYGVAGPYVKLGVLEHASSAALNISTSNPTIVFDDYIRCKPLQSAGVNLMIFNRQLLDLKVDATNSPFTFTQHLPFFPVTIPLTGQVEPTVN